MKKCAIVGWLIGCSLPLLAQDYSGRVVDMLVFPSPLPDTVTVFGETIALNRLDMRERYDREINGFTYLHSTTMLYLKRANRYFPIIEPILKAHNIPDDFKYLCVIESGLDTRALSPVKAAGLWQFMDFTAKMYGLEINDYVDERYHIEKATEAACSYFQAAYDKFGSWTDVAAAYNAGFSRISIEESKQMVTSAFDLLLVQETSRYVFRIMACKAVFENPAKYGFILKKEDLYPPIPLTQVNVESDILDFSSFAQKYGINYMQLKEFNVWLRDTKLMLSKNSNKTYQIAIPKKEDLYFKPESSVTVRDTNLITINNNKDMKQELINELIQLAFKEDIGDGDHTTLSTIPDTAMGKVQLKIKENGVLAGVAVAQQIFHTFDPKLKMTVLIPDGEEVKVGDIAFTVEGKTQSLLQTERLVLNVMQRMSGIATTTRKYVKQLEGTTTKVLDTRKTTPGLRMLEKEAVKIGGGENHRIGLFDMILLKDNHVDFAGGIEKALSGTKAYLKQHNKHLPIEIEVRNFDELNQVLTIGGIDRIMLDNFSVEDTRKAVELVNGKYPLESSGGITSETLREYAETGVDYISVGALTHSVKSLDMSLKAM